MHRSSTLTSKRNAMRPPPPPVRPSHSRTFPAAATTHSGRASPADSLSSMASKQLSPPNQSSLKRKEREFDQDGGEETNINVVVRCRGRNEREVRENSGVVVSTDGVKGKTVELSMGPNAVSNKAYHFDKVFSSAADQGMVFDEVVSPILDEVLAGFNCTIFAYGQTGTGKTYTMSGDISDVLPIPDAAGIIPRVFHSLFGRLSKEDAASGSESNVKCSFIELYNEELRDLLAADESVKLKIFDDANKKTQATTLVQGMEEYHIRTASRGLELLREGSHKRQVAATKCNDLSSRSHTVFTVTVHMKRILENGEEFVSVGKLNLVDLAGSENIQRSGAENKRAAEAGLINKSLLTLGRVINALVERGSHIPYRESKLTRLLQDSLGGRTKTCIIATLSPAKSNLEDIISTLDYASRAKSIRNKPQMNQLMSKKTLIAEFTAEIEKLKSELIATRHRNGVYLTSETYEEMTIESESRRILSEEQRDRITTMEANLRNKAQELFELTNSFNNLKKDSEAIKEELGGTQDVLRKTDIVLAHTKERLAGEAMLRQAHQSTEEELARRGQDLISTLSRTTTDISGLHSKLRRRSDLQTVNRDKWTWSQSQVSDTTAVVQQRMRSFEEEHRQLMAQLTSKMTGYLKGEFEELSSSESFLNARISDFGKAEIQVNAQTGKARDDVDVILEEIKTLKGEVKQRVGEGLDGLSQAAKSISAGVIAELERFHTQVSDGSDLLAFRYTDFDKLHSSYSALGKDFKHTFDDLVNQLNNQRTEADTLRKELSAAGEELVKANARTSLQLNTLLTEEKERAANDRADLLTQVAALIEAHGQAQDRRLDGSSSLLQAEIGSSTKQWEEKLNTYQTSMDEWSRKDRAIVDVVLQAREQVKLKIKTDWTVSGMRSRLCGQKLTSKTANEHNSAIKSTTQAVHEETVQIVDNQLKNLDVQLQALDEILQKVREQNTKHHDSHTESLSELSATVKESYTSIGKQLQTAADRGREFESSFENQMASISACFEPLDSEVHAPLSELRSNIIAAPITEYKPTGETPQKLQYQYSPTLPRTQPHGTLLDDSRSQHLVAMTASPSKSHLLSPSKTTVYTDTSIEQSLSSSPLTTRKSSRPESSHVSLRELDVNTTTAVSKADAAVMSSAVEEKIASHQQPPMKRQNTVTLSHGKSVLCGDARVAVDDSTVSTTFLPDEKMKDFSASVGSKGSKRTAAEGRENQPFSASVGAGGRVLRSRGS